MLDCRNDPVRLDPRNRRAAEHARQQRIFAQILERPPVARVTDQVDPARQQHVETFGLGFAADHHAARAHDRRVPCRSQQHARGKRGRPVLAQAHDIGNAKAGIGFAQRRHL